MSRSDLEATPPSDEGGRTPDERFEDRVKMAVPDRHSPRLRAVIAISVGGHPSRTAANASRTAMPTSAASPWQCRNAMRPVAAGRGDASSS